MKRSFFQAVVVSILLYGCTTWTLTKRLERKLDGNYTRMLRAVLNKSWRQHPTRLQLYGHLPPITKTIQVRRTRHAGHCWRSKDQLISDVLLWTPTYGCAKVGRPARTYIQQLCEDTGCIPEDLPEAMNDKGEMAREGQGYPRWQRDMMMMMMRNEIITLNILYYFCLYYQFYLSANINSDIFLEFLLFWKWFSDFDCIKHFICFVKKKKTLVFRVDFVFWLIYICSLIYFFLLKLFMIWYNGILVPS